MLKKELKKQMNSTIQKYKMLDIGDTVLVAISGGADSVALLHLLHSLNLLNSEISNFNDKKRLSLVAVHVNHNLRGDEAWGDESFVRGLCADLDVPLKVYSVDVHAKKSRGLSLEEAARQLRYASLEEAAKLFGANKIAIAHNKNDNAETVLLNLCRGTGLKGLGGIMPVRGNIIRPLIEISRKTIEAYLNENNISFRTDSSNVDETLLRNRIRHSVIPVLETINPRVVPIISHNTNLIREEDDYLNTLAIQALETCLEASLETLLETSLEPSTFSKSQSVLSLHVPTLLQYPIVLQRRVLRTALFKADAKKGLYDYSYAHIEQLLDLLQNGKTGKKVRFPSDIYAWREYETLLIGLETSSPQPFCIDIPLDERVYISALGGYVHASCTLPMMNSLENSSEICTKHFNYDKIKGILQVRTRCPGDFIVLLGGGRKKLQDEFTDRKVPRARRDTIPLLVTGNNILWVMDSSQRINAAFQPEPGCNMLAVSIDRLTK